MTETVATAAAVAAHFCIVAARIDSHTDDVFNPDFFAMPEIRTHIARAAATVHLAAGDDQRAAATLSETFGHLGALTECAREARRLVADYEIPIQYLAGKLRADGCITAGNCYAALIRHELARSTRRAAVM